MFMIRSSRIFDLMFPYFLNVPVSIPNMFGLVNKMSLNFAQNILKYGNKLLEPAIDYRIYFRLHILF